MVWQASLFVAITAALLGSGAVAVGWAVTREVLRRRRSTRGEAEPACGRCGYIIHPGSRKLCPECGSDFGTVGIVTASTAPPAFPILALWVACVGATLFAWWAGPRLAAATPWGWDFHAGRVIHTSKTTWVPNMHEGAFSVNAQGIGRGWSVRVQTLNVTYKIPDRPYITLDIEQGGARCEIRTRPKFIGPLPLGPDIVAQFVQAAGFDPASAEGGTLRDAILTRARQFLANDLPPETGRYSGDWPHRAVFDSVQFWPNDYTTWVAGAIVWTATVFVAIVGLRWWQRWRRRVVIRRGQRYVGELGLTG